MKNKFTYIIFVFVISLFSISYADVIDYDYYQEDDGLYGDYGENRNNLDNYSVSDDTNEIIKVYGDYSLIINDEAQLINKEFFPEIIEAMERITEYGNVMLLTTYDVPYEEYESYADKMYDETFGDLSNGVLLLIDMNNRMAWIHSDGDILKVITSSKAEIITDNIYKSLKIKEYAGGSVKAFEQIYDYLNNKKVFSSMTLITNLLLSISISFLGVYIYIYKAAHIKNVEGKKYTEKLDIKYKITRVAGEHIGVRRVYSPQSSGGGYSGGGSSHGSGGHGSHGSHSSGGGGGHRF